MCSRSSDADTEQDPFFNIMSDQFAANAPRRYCLKLVNIDPLSSDEDSPFDSLFSFTASPVDSPSYATTTFQHLQLAPRSKAPTPASRPTPHSVPRSLAHSSRTHSPISPLRAKATGTRAKGPSRRPAPLAPQTPRTPVTPESFAKWKRTRMDKKLAEEEALKKAKDEKHAAGKSSGMSGRDLVRLAVIDSISAMLTNVHLHSLHTTRSGSRTMTNPRKSGILPSTGRSRRTRILQRKKNVSANYSSVKADLLKLRQTMQTVAPSELHTAPSQTLPPCM